MLDAPGVVLEAPTPCVSDDALARWRERVRDMSRRLGWPSPSIVVRRHQAGATLGFDAPPSCLLTATEVNEWAWLGAVTQPAPWPSPLGPAQPVHDANVAQVVLQLMAQREEDPRLTALRAESAQRGMPCFGDDESLTIGAGRWSHTWALDALPSSNEVPWEALRGVPMALVTGSNGKTTTVRLLAAMCAAHGWVTSHSSTDGVRVQGEMIAEGDWAGPAGARLALRDARVEAAVLETARGGVLRRGLAVTGAQAAVVTNVQSDHFGEYGIDDSAALAEAKLVVAKGLATDGTLVLNADDPQLVAASSKLRGNVAWFSLDAASPLIKAARDARRPCAVEEPGGVLALYVDGMRVALGEAQALPLAAAGLAQYNVANMLAASLAAWAMGIPGTCIAGVLARFGTARGDNPGRLMRWTLDGATVLLDYAHNPAGMAGLLAVAAPLKSATGQLMVLLGQAGNREDFAIRDLAGVVAAARPDVIALKDMPTMLRGRAPGEVPALLAESLRRAGQPEASLCRFDDEAEAAQALVSRARPGDVVVLPVHARDARDAVIAWLDAREG